MATRFDYRNLGARCKEENCSEGGKSYEDGIATDTNFGKGQCSNFLNLQQTTKQWEIGELGLVILLIFLSRDLLKPTNAKAGFFSQAFFRCRARPWKSGSSHV